jgi:hypothetical protein
MRLMTMVEGAEATTAGSGSGARSWAGRILSGFVALFLFFDGGARLVGFAPYVEGLAPCGYAVELAPWIAVSLLVPTILYVVPRTAILGAILITGYLGGATATHVRVGSPWFLFAVAFGVIAWGGLWLRDPLLRDLIPIRREARSSSGSE